jgi:RNA polymerase sigma-70 factor (ECF subfamily)
MGEIERCNAASEISALFEQVRAPLLRYLACLGIAADDGRDIAQEAFLRLCRDFHCLGGVEHARAWLFRVAHNEARNRQKSSQCRRTESLEQYSEAHERIAGAEDNPERALMRRQRARQVRAAMERLSALERNCVLLRSEGLRYREIAEALDLRVSTVAETLYRAIRKLGEECDV